MTGFARICIALSTLAMFLMANAEEKKIERSDLPPAVEKTVAAQGKDAAIHGFSEERENGQTYYEAELIAAGHHRDVLIDAKGTIVEVEEEVAFESLPPVVKKHLLAKAGKGTLQNVESLTKHGTLVAYEAQVVVNGKHSEIQVGPQGESLPHEE
jgi:hypothetical protein